MSVSEPEFREPYPIYRALRVPVWEKGELVRVRRVTNEDRDEFKRAMHDRLRPILERLIELANATGSGEDERLELIADAMVMFLRAPLVQEVSPVAPTPLKAHAVMLLPRQFAGAFWDEGLREFAENLNERSISIQGQRVTFSDIVRGYFQELFQLETADLVFRFWIAFPADTRPGYNTSSLIAHSLMTSAIAWALSYRADRRSVAMLRLAALLHDLGKALNPSRHHEASAELARRLLGGLVRDVTLDELLREIERHHVGETVLRDADRLASAADRLSRLVRQALKDKIQKIREVLRTDKTERDWKFWSAVHDRRDELIKAGLFREDPIREMTEKFLWKVDSLVRSPEYREVEPFRDERISLVLIDFASIQDFVRRGQEIRVVAAASHLIELAVHSHLPWYLRRELGLPPEAVLYSGGGNLLLLVPSEVLEELKRVIEEYGERNGLELKVGRTDFTDDYVKASEQLAIELYKEKHRVGIVDSDGHGSSQELFESVDKLCEICFNASATETLVTPAGERKEVCKICRELYDVGSDQHFGAKWKAEIEIRGDKFSAAGAFRKDWSKVSRWVMEVISGHDPEEFVSGKPGSSEESEKGVTEGRKGVPERRRDYAIVKFDGNAMGRFMMESVSFTDAVERSFRVDAAVKRAYMKAMEALYEGVRQTGGEEAARKEVARVFLGTIYMGGDDGFLLAPSWASLPFAHLMAEEFSRQLGLERGLRVAVAAGPAMMSVWSLLDCAEEMMKVSRTVLRHVGRGLKQDQVLGAIAFDVFEAGSPSAATARERMERLSWKARHAKRRPEDGPLELLEPIDGVQPYLVMRGDLEGSTVPELWSSVGRVVFRVNPPGRWNDHDGVMSFYVDLFNRSYRISRFPKGSTGEDELVEWVKNVRSAILRSWGQVSPSRYWREKLIVYFLRQRERGEEKELASAYRELAELGLQTVVSNWFWSKIGVGSPDESSSSAVSVKVGPFPLADVLTLVKLVKGGAW